MNPWKDVGGWRGRVVVGLAVLLGGCGAAPIHEGDGGNPDSTERVEPVFVSGERPAYTKAAFESGMSGTVHANCIISAAGVPVYCRHLSPVPGMEMAIAAALRTWRFEPGRIDGVAADFEVNLAFPLVLPPQGWIPPEEKPIDPKLEALIRRDGGMMRPTRLSGRDPYYPRAARLKRAQGTVIARCVLTVQGNLERCTIVASTVPILNQPVLDALDTMRYSPVTFLGKPVATEYTIPFKFRLQ